MATSTSGSDAEAEAAALRLVERLEGGAAVTAETRQRLFAALVSRYAEARVGSPAPPLAAGSVPAEAVAVTAAEMLRSAAVTTFELAALFDV